MLCLNRIYPVSPTHPLIRTDVFLLVRKGTLQVGAAHGVRPLGINPGQVSLRFGLGLLDEGTGWFGGHLAFASCASGKRVRGTVCACVYVVGALVRACITRGGVVGLAAAAIPFDRTS